MKKCPWFYPRSLSKQLLVCFGISVATVGVATLGINYHLIQTDLREQVQEQAQSITQSLEFSTEGLLEVEHKTILRRVVQNYATLPGVIEIAIVNPDGSLLARSPQPLFTQSYASIYPELAKELEQASTTGREISYQKIINGKSVIVGMMPFKSTIFEASERRGVAIAIVDLQQMQAKAWHTFSTSTATLFGGSLIILVLMGVILEATVLRPLRYVNEAVIGCNGSGHFEIPSTLPDNEIRFLATRILEAIVNRKEAYENLQSETVQRQQWEEAHQQLEQTLRELQETQAQMIQSEKMSALGNLVAGVAHEMNNPIGFLKGSLKNAEDYVRDLLQHLQYYQDTYPQPTLEIQEHAEDIDLPFLQEDLPKLLTSMQAANQRIQGISTSLRTFSRADTEHTVKCNLHEGIDSTLLILKYRLKANNQRPEIEVIKDYGDLPMVECFPGQLNQVFMNLLANAIDALDEWILEKSVSYFGRITIHTTHLPEQDAVRIVIQDNGPGISEDVRRRIFDHLFTTKGVGKGTGLGLSIARQIVEEKHGGQLSCQSEVGKGTEFTIQIPIGEVLDPSRPNFDGKISQITV